MAVVQTVVAGEIFWRLQRAVLLQPARRSAEHRTAYAKAAGDSPRFRVIGDPYRHVDTLANQAHRVIIDIQLQAQLRIAGEKIG